MLCYRCEHRAHFLETGERPRYECGEINKSKYACYMYKPCKPIAMKRHLPEKQDPGPEHAGFFGCRMEFSKFPDVELYIKRLNKKESVLLWKIKK